MAVYTTSEGKEGLLRCIFS